MTIPPPLPVQTKPQQSSAWTVIRIILQLLLLVPSLIMLPFILVFVGLPGVLEARNGNPLATTPVAMAIPYAVGFIVIVASVFLRLRSRWLAVLFPLVGLALFAASAFVLNTKFKGPGGSRQTKEIAGMFGGAVIVAAWNAARGIRTNKNEPNVA